MREAKYSFISHDEERYTSAIKDKVDIENYFQKLWEYIIYISAMKAVVETNSDEKLAFLKYYLNREGFLIEIDNFVDLFSSIYKEDMSNNEINKATSLNQFAINRLGHEDFITALKTLRAHLSEENRILIVIDTLEKYYAKEEEFRYAVHGMMEAIYEIKLNPKSKWIDIKCFIPDELFEDFASWNLNKVYDVCTFMTWKYHELLYFICKRVISYIEENYDPLTVEKYKNKWKKVDTNDRNSLRSFWHEFFPKNITDRFGASEDCFNYILRHTQNKPRQIIHLVNKIINVAEKRGNIPNIKPSDVCDGIHADLDQLITDNFKPFLDQYQDLMSCVKTMFEGESNILDGRIVKDCIKKCTKDLIKMGLSEQQFEKILLRSGLLGIVSKESIQNLPDGRQLKICYTSFDYLLDGHLEKLTTESKCALHSLLADFYDKKIKLHTDICVYPYAGMEHDAEPDQLFDPKRLEYLS